MARGEKESLKGVHSGGRQAALVQSTADVPDVTDQCASESEYEVRVQYSVWQSCDGWSLEMKLVSMRLAAPASPHRPPRYPLAAGTCGQHERPAPLVLRPCTAAINLKSPLRTKGTIVGMGANPCRWAPKIRLRCLPNRCIVRPCMQRLSSSRVALLRCAATLFRTA